MAYTLASLLTVIGLLVAWGFRRDLLLSLRQLPELVRLRRPLQVAEGPAELPAASVEAPPPRPPAGPPPVLAPAALPAELREAEITRNGKVTRISKAHLRLWESVAAQPGPQTHQLAARLQHSPRYVQQLTGELLQAGWMYRDLSNRLYVISAPKLESLSNSGGLPDHVLNIETPEIPPRDRAAITPRSHPPRDLGGVIISGAPRDPYSPLPTPESHDSRATNYLTNELVSSDEQDQPIGPLPAAPAPAPTSGPAPVSAPPESRQGRKTPSGPIPPDQYHRECTAWGLAGWTALLAQLKVSEAEVLALGGRADKAPRTGLVWRYLFPSAEAAARARGELPMPGKGQQVPLNLAARPAEPDREGQAWYWQELEVHLRELASGALQVPGVTRASLRAEIRDPGRARRFAEELGLQEVLRLLDEGAG